MIARFLTATLFVLMASVPAWAYTEILTVQSPSTDGYCGRAIQQFTTSIAASATKIFIAYMGNSGTVGSCGAQPHPIKALQYDYDTGVWTSSTVDSGVSPSCCDGHDAPGTFRSPVSNKIMVTFGAISCGETGSGLAPCYRESTSADSISAWDASRSRAATPGGFSEQNGEYDSSNVLHIVGQHQINVPYSAEYARFNGSTWDGARLIKCNPDCNDGFNGAPYAQYLAVRGSTIHLVWSATNTGWGSGTDTYYAKSTDGGANWCNVSGASCVARTTGLVSTFNSGRSLHEWPNYTVQTGITTSHNLSVDVLSDGNPVIASRQTSVGAVIYRWTGSAWTRTIVDSTATEGYGLGMVVTSNGTVLLYGPRDLGGCSPAGCDGMFEWSSTNCPSSCTFTRTTLDSSVGTVHAAVNAKKFSNLAGKERVIVQWVTGQNNSNNTVQVIDRPQTAASAVSFSDLFNRANNADLGTSWTQETGFPMQIVNNRVRPTVVNTISEEIVMEVSPANDQYSKFLIQTFTNDGSYNDARAIVRATDPGVARTFYMCVAYQNNGGVTSQIFRWAAGNPFDLTSESATTWGPGDTIECRAVGTTISLLRTPSGSTTATTLLSITDSVITGGRIGMGAFAAGAVSNIEFDNYNAGDYPPTSVTFPNFPIASDYPAVAVLDNFDRANSGSLGASWTVVSGGGFTIASNQAAAPASATQNLYTANQIQQDQEVYGTWTTIPACCGYTTLINFAGTAISANSQYRLQINRQSGGNALAKVIKVDSGGSTTATPIAETDLGGDIVDGNSFGIRVSGTTVSAYWKYSDGIWYRIGQATDATLPIGSLYGGISGASPAVINDFGAGPLVTQPPQSPPTPAGNFTGGGRGRFGTTFPGVR